jgi:hypothetical protein
VLITKRSDQTVRIVLPDDPSPFDSCLLGEYSVLSGIQRSHVHRRHVLCPCLVRCLLRIEEEGVPSDRHYISSR